MVKIEISYLRTFKSLFQFLLNFSLFVAHLKKDVVSSVENIWSFNIMVKINDPIYVNQYIKIFRHVYKLEFKSFTEKCNGL